MNLLLVESPHKAETISQWLNKKEWKVIATIGHIKNLPKNDYGIVKDGKEYKANWKVIENKNKLISYIRESIKQSNKVFIATDDDREGERIAFDVADHFKLKDYYRIIFHEVTKKAIEEALKNAIYIDEDKVNAQKARRMIDRIVGYSMSSAIRWYFKTQNIFNEEIIKKMGIGRVSAAALAIIIRNEREIETFIPEIYKKIYVDYVHTFTDEKTGERKTLQFTVTSIKQKYKEKLFEELNTLYKNITDERTEHVVENFQHKEQKVAPYPPLITSRVLRSLNYLYGYKPDDSMKVLQKLYDGIQIGNEKIGLITYHRTDSFNISDEAIDEIIKCLTETFGEEYVVNSKREYKNKNSTAQEAHEAIRPTSFTNNHFPKNIKRYLSDEEYRIYEFIFYRTLATQMKNSSYDRSKIVINIGGNKFQAFANKRIFDGWEKLLNDRIRKSENQEINEEEIELPQNLYIGDNVKFIGATISERKDKTPPQIGLGRFITILEDNNIGRPSTVSTITSGLEKRGFIKVENNMIRPTIVGTKLISFLEEYCEWLVDVEHAEQFEKELDEIEENGKFLPLIEEYDKLKDEFFSKINYMYRPGDDTPPEWLLEKAKKIAEKKDETLSSQQLSSKKLLNKYCSDYAKQTKVGKCPICKVGELHEREKLFACNKMECNCVIWKSSINNFFENFGVYVPEHTFINVIKHLLKNKKMWVNDLYSKNKDSHFSAFIVLKPSDYKKENLELNLSFPKSKNKTIDEKYIFNFEKKNNIADESNNNDTTSNNYIQVDEIPLPNKKNEDMQKEIEKLKEERRNLKNDIYKDEMTRAYNKKKFNEDMEEYSSNNDIKNISFAFIDGDKFKTINDTYGHDAGDETIKHMANVMFETTRGHNLNVYRLGGDEFGIISKESNVKSQKLLEELRINMEKSNIVHNANSFTITISVGLAHGRANEIHTDLIKRADKLQYKAKESRNKVVFEQKEEEALEW